MFRKNKDKKKLYKLLIVILCFTISFFVYHKTSLGNSFSKSINQLFSNSLYYLNNTINFGKTLLNRFTLNQTLYDENLSLNKELRSLKDELNTKQAQEKEDLLLKSELKYYSSINKNIATTELFSISPGPYFKEGLIAAGSNVGLEKGDVALYRDMLLGRVIDVYNNYSKILLIFDSRSKISAITDDTRKKILLSGNNTNHLIINYLPETEIIKDLEIVTTSNHCSLFPPGIKIGVVKSNNIDSTYVEIPYNIKDIRYVKIIRNESNAELLNQQDE